MFFFDVIFLDLKITSQNDIIGIYYQKGHKMSDVKLPKRYLNEDEYTHLEETLKSNEITLLTGDTLDGMTIDTAYQLGYQLLSTNENKILFTDRGPLISMIDTTNNNGIYILRKEGNAYLLEVIIPNNIDKSTHITNILQTMDNSLNAIDVSDLEVYDLTVVYGHLVVNQVIKPLARALFPDNELKQSHFVDVYLPRFLANAARYYIGDSSLLEETVNSEPHVVKIMMEGSEEFVKHPKETEEKNV